MKKYTVEVPFTVGGFVTRLEWWDLFRTDRNKPSSKEDGEAPVTGVSYEEIQEFLYRRWRSGRDVGLPTLALLKAAKVPPGEIGEWTRGVEYFARGFSGCNLYRAKVRKPDGSVETYRSDYHAEEVGFRLVYGLGLTGFSEMHKEPEYRRRYVEQINRRFKESGSTARME